MNEDFGGIFDEPKWTDSDAFEEVFLVWRARPDLGLVVVPQPGTSEPRVIFCNLADGGRMFMDGRDHPDASMTLSEARTALDYLEELWVRRKRPVEEG